MAAEPMQCLDADTVLELLEDEVSSERRAAIDAHIDACAECRRLLLKLAQADLPSRGSESETFGARVDRHPSPPEVVAGRYQITGLLGKGGMGVVLKGRPLGGGPELALKRLLFAEGDPLSRRRLTREAEVVRALDHPNIVRVVDFDEDEHGDLFIAMERLHGEDLAARLARGPLPPAEVVRIGLAAAAGLAVAHAAGVVHRDVKPSNLFCCSDGRVKVLDFGLALVVADAIEPRLTLSGRLMGTPAYMAVEQVQAHRSEDERTDIWGLGATLYHAVCGRPPFGAPSTTATLVRIAMEEPDPLPASVPPALADVLLRTLQKDRSARFRHMSALADALRACAPSVEGLEAAERAPSIPPVLGEVRVVAALVAIEARTEEARAEVRGAIERHGGTATVLRGSKMAGLFGHLEWVGDESRRAARAALEAAAWCRAVGVGTGTATWRPGEVRTIAGAAIVAAEQALSARPVGACPETRRRLLGAFEMEGARLLSERPGAEAAGPREIAGVEVPMLGRDAELVALRGLFERTRRDARAQAVLVVGPPGIGKSRLLHELRVWIEGQGDRVTVLRGRGEPRNGTPSYGTIAGLLRRRAALPIGAAVGAARARVEALVASAGLEGDAARGANDFVGRLFDLPAHEGAPTSSQEKGDRIRRSVGDLFEGWSMTGPVVLLLEDVHWADAASLDLVELLGARLSERPFLTVATSRNTEVLPGARRIELGELGLREAEAIVERILGRPEPAIARRAGGTPFFAEELSLAVREGADPAALPLTVQGAVQARLDGLPEDERDALKRAAVLGTRFRTEALVALGRRDAAELLPRLRRRDLVVPRLDGPLGGTTEWTFRHPLLQEVAYGMLVPEQLRGLHLRAATWLRGRGDARPEEVATHYEAAGDAASATRLWIAATFTAHARGDSRAVLGASERLFGGAGAVSLEPAEEHALRLARVEAFTWLGLAEREDAELDELASLETRAAAGRAPLTASARAQTLRRRAYSLERRGRYSEALPWASAAIGLADGVDMPTAAAARTVLAFSLAHTGRLDEALEAADLAVTLAERCEDPLEWCRAQTARSLVATFQGAPASSLAHLKRAAQRAEEAGSGRETARACSNVGWALLGLGDLAGARAALEKALGLARSLGIPAAEGYALSNLAFTLGRLGETERALECSRRALELAAVTDRPQLAAGALMLRAVVAVEAGQAAAALDDIEEALRRAAAGGFVLFDAPCRFVRARALHALGRRAEAVDECRLALEARRRAGGMESFEIDLLEFAGEVFAETGLVDEAAVSLGAARALYEERRARIADPVMQRTYTENIPAHARLAAGSR